MFNAQFSNRLRWGHTWALNIVYWTLSLFLLCDRDCSIKIYLLNRDCAVTAFLRIFHRSAAVSSCGLDTEMLRSVASVSFTSFTSSFNTSGSIWTIVRLTSVFMIFKFNDLRCCYWAIFNGRKNTKNRSKKCCLQSSAAGSLFAQFRAAKIRQLSLMCKRNTGILSMKN